MSRHARQKLTDLCREADEFIPSSETVRSSRQRIGTDFVYPIAHQIHWLWWTPVDGFTHPQRTHFSGSHGACTPADHALGHPLPYEFKRTDPDGTNPGIHQRKTGGKSQHSWRWKHTRLENTWVKDETSRETLKYSDLNENKNDSSQWGGAQQKQSLEGNLQQWTQISVSKTKNQSAKLPP